MVLAWPTLQYCAGGLPTMKRGSSSSTSCKDEDAGIEALLLLASGAADVTLRNREGETPLETAITSGAHVRYIECAALLCAYTRILASQPPPTAGRARIRSCARRTTGSNTWACSL